MYPIASILTSDNKKNNSSSKKFNKKFKFSIATLNVQHLTQLKLDDTVEYMENNNIDILGLAETSLNDSTSKIFAKSISDHYVLYSSEGEKKGSGVRFLIKKEYDKYIQS